MQRRRPLSGISAALIAALVLAPIPPSAAAELVEFESAEFTIQPSPFKLKQAKRKGIELKPDVVPGTLLSGSITIPDGVGPFPAIVLLHGCNGISRWNEIWSKRFAAWGYVTLSVDSFTARNLNYTCTDDSNHGASTWNRALDPLGAKTYLSKLDIVDPARVFVVGMSHGGGAVLHAIEQSTLTGAKIERFRAAIALYPLCRELKNVETPTLILIGDADEWTLASWCDRYVSRLKDPHQITLHVFQGVHHLFDIEGADGEAHGLTIRYDADAALQAERMIKDFLDTHTK